MNTLLTILLILILITLAAVLALLLKIRAENTPHDPEQIVKGHAESLRNEFERARKSDEERDVRLREEIGGGVLRSTESLQKTLETRFDLIDANQGKRLKELRDGNEKKLEEMRKTVDEKLQGTLEKRLGEAFKQVSERLETVQRGLGEMKQLAADVGDFKKVLTNVKSRGTWGEVQLRSILEEMLAPAQFEANVKTNPSSNDIVEFAIKLPGNDSQDQVWLPIDAKFPQEDFLRLQEAQDIADPEATEIAARGLEQAIIKAATDIKKKYLAPPHTTNFAILFLPTEGLYAEALRRSKLVDEAQNLRITLAGPTTLGAILNALRMGFQTLAIEQRSNEVREVLGAVKTEFGKFGDVLDKVQKQLQAAQRSIETTGTRTRAMERKLKSVEELPESQSQQLLELDEISPE